MERKNSHVQEDDHKANKNISFKQHIKFLKHPMLTPALNPLCLTIETAKLTTNAIIEAQNPHATSHKFNPAPLHPCNTKNQARMELEMSWMISVANKGDEEKRKCGSV